jgi:signal transduction histidine kinase
MVCRNPVASFVDKESSHCIRYEPSPDETMKTQIAAIFLALGLHCPAIAGFAEDTVTAYMLWDLAAASGHRNAGEQRDDLARRMTAHQIDEAQRLSRNWHPGMGLP